MVCWNSQVCRRRGDNVSEEEEDMGYIGVVDKEMLEGKLRGPSN